MAYQFIITEVEKGVMLLKFNRPEVLNSFTIPMSAEVHDALRQAASDPAIRAVLITGEGRGFCAGQDLSEAVTTGGPSIRDIVNKTYNPMILAIRQLEKPVICAVNGVAAGAGANIAFACDITLASESASFIQSFSKIGLIPDSAGTFFLPRLVGMQRATALTMLADKITAAQAQAFGLIWKTCPADKLMEEATAMAQQLAAMPTVGLGLTKRALNLGLSQNLEQQLETEAELQDQAARSADHKEGVQAFLEKRAPVFNGN